MNRFRAVYCRIFQQAFHLAIPFLPYRQPEIFYSTSKLPPLFEKKHIRKVMVITDPGVRSLGLIDRMLMHMDHHDISYVIYDKTVANPTNEQVEEAKELYLAEGCEALIGFGGGSSMDCAKAVGARLARPKKSLKQMAGILKVRKKLPLLIAIPTTAGTGSETTLAAVITDAQTRYKYAINDFPLIPRYAVLDPKTTLSLPPMLTATTGLDALTHAVEAYIGGSTTPKTRKYARKAVKLIFENLQTAVQDGQNAEARKHMLEAAYYAGCAFTVSYVGYVHAIAHSLGGKYNVPHGLANAVLLPTVLEAYGDSVWKKLSQLAVEAGLVEKGTDEQEAAERFIEAIKAMKQEFGIGDTFEQIRLEDIPEMARHAEHEANPLYPVPVLWNAKELERLYLAVMESKEE
ncbi:MAG: iron-containing alcohol dehydrogenase [Lachnospiraceae bacterium]|nr:iron-containing alcohol dehydrogenase [Lachnospiraceae bacterium]